MNPFYALLALASAASAAEYAANSVQYYGKTPSIEDYSAMEALSREIFEATGASGLSVLRTDDLDGDDMRRYLESGGFYNMTFADVRALNKLPEGDALSTRDTVTCDSSNKVFLSDEGQFQVCNVLSIIAGGSTTYASYLVHGYLCDVASNGYKTFCTGIFSVTGTVGSALTGSEVRHFCPGFFTSVEKCNGKGGDVTNADYELIVSVTQKDVTCGDQPAGPCTQTSIS